MARKRYTIEQIITKLREAEVELSRGKKTPEVCRKLGVSENTYYRWRKEYGGLRTDQARVPIVRELFRNLVTAQGTRVDHNPRDSRFQPTNYSCSYCGPVAEKSIARRERSFHFDLSIESWSDKPESPRSQLSWRVLSPNLDCRDRASRSVDSLRL